MGTQTTDREKAMEWWNTLRNTNLRIGSKDKGYYCENFDYMRMWQNLTGSEIEQIWRKETQK